MTAILPVKEQTPHSVCVFLFLTQKHAKGQELLMKVCDHVNLLEKDYFGLANWETPTNKVGWLFCPSGCSCSTKAYPVIIIFPYFL